MPRRYARQRGRSAALITVVTVRSNSRISGDTSCEQLTSCPRARSASATNRSCAGSMSAWSRHTATASTSPSMSGSPPASTGASTDPSAARRPTTSYRQPRGTSGSGREASWS